MKLLKSGRTWLAGLVTAGLLMTPFFSGCDSSSGDGDGGGDVGDNDPNLVACVGDSLTQGYNCEGAPYPSRLGPMSGKTVLNFGVGGSTSSYGVSIISSVVSRKPGYVCILFGSNDAIQGRDAEITKENLRGIIAVCKANNSIPIIGTPPPMIGAHLIYDSAAARIAEAVRQLGKEEGVTVIDFYKAFGDGTPYLGSDGLHLSEAGGDLIAQKFNTKL